MQIGGDIAEILLFFKIQKQEFVPFEGIECGELKVNRFYFRAEIFKDFNDWWNRFFGGDKMKHGEMRG
ncbi:hypothetical protein GCM10009119_31750 [Algoriphagus jejuensis]|uniref:Uncharacterized protein n=1 Tax=Algoriphagus jejuensis TaxID=419934 RepID=A0ABP3YG17_9BACT